MKVHSRLAVLALAAVAMPNAAHATVLNYEAYLDGPSESPANASPATGFATASYDDVARTLTLDMSFSGLLGTTTAAHIHGPTGVAGTGTASVATTTPLFAGFPIGVSSGSYNVTLDLTAAGSYNPIFVTNNGGTTAGAEAALAAALAGGKAYLNIHSTVFGGGEIRGFFQLAVPEPASWAMMIGGFALTGAALRRRGALAPA
jgi:hypothetical protein